MGDPRITFLVCCYQQERYIRASLLSALGQDYSNLEVLVIDDSSSDGTWSIVQDIKNTYTGPHELNIIRHEMNQGGIETFLEGYKKAKGEWIVLNDGDDISFPNRAKTIAQVSQSQPCSLIASNALILDYFEVVKAHYRTEKTSVKVTLKQLIEAKLSIVREIAMSAVTS